MVQRLCYWLQGHDLATRSGHLKATHINLAILAEQLLQILRLQVNKLGKLLKVSATHHLQNIIYKRTIIQLLRNDNCPAIISVSLPGCSRGCYRHTYTQKKPTTMRAEYRKQHSKRRATELPELVARLSADCRSTEQKFHKQSNHQGSNVP